MTRLGLFPLPLVLVPTERVPLHIFEPRYRELIGECIERDEEFGVLLESAGGGAPRSGRGRPVGEVLRRLPDGRMHVAVEGGERFRLLEVHQDRRSSRARGGRRRTRTIRRARRTSSRCMSSSVACRRRRLVARAAGRRFAAARLPDRLAGRLRQRPEAGTDRDHITPPALRAARRTARSRLEALTSSGPSSRRPNGKVTPLSGDADLRAASPSGSRRRSTPPRR